MGAWGPDFSPIHGLSSHIAALLGPSKLPLASPLARDTSPPLTRPTLRRPARTSCGDTARRRRCSGPPRRSRLARKDQAAPAARGRPEASVRVLMTAPRPQPRVYLHPCARTALPLWPRLSRSPLVSLARGRGAGRRLGSPFPQRAQSPRRP